MRLARRAVPAAVLLSLLVLLASCTSSSDGSDSSSAPPTGASAATGGSGSGAASASASAGQGLRARAQTYVSVGDSYAAGYQPGGKGKPGATTRNGFTDQVVTLAKGKGYDLTLVNFGCSGATTTSALTSPGCLQRNRAQGAPAYTQPQVTAASDYLKAHRGKVGLVTIVLGGNDITPCAATKTTSEATGCVGTALGKIAANITRTVKTLRDAAGPATRIVGLTYPDVFLGEALASDKTSKDFANLSVLAFQSLINPQLKTAYATGGATFADVTSATGAYTPQTQTTTLPPYGTIPVAVAKVCQLTYFCELRDIHPRTSGYQIIAQLVVKALPQR